MIKNFLEIGKFVSTHGIRGELKVQYFCDHSDVICGFDTLYLNKGETSFIVEYCRPNKNVVIIKFEGINTVQEAQKYIGKMLYISRNDIELPENTWFIQDIIGLSVYDADTNECYGIIDEIYQNGSADVYSIKTPSGKQLMFPAVPQVLLETNIKDGKIIIRPLENLFTLD